MRPELLSAVRTSCRVLLTALLLPLLQPACASTRTVKIVSERPAEVKLTDGTPVCASTPCNWSFSTKVCRGPFHSYSPFIGLELTDGEQTFRSPMLRFCELDEGDVIEVPMSGNATLTRATIEFVDGHIEWFTEYALHISRAKVVSLSLAPPGEHRGTVKIELELEEPPLKGPSRPRHMTTFESFHHTGRFARHLPKIRKTTLAVGDSVFYFDMGRPPSLTPGTHIENVSDRGAEILRLLGKR